VRIKATAPLQWTN